MLKTSYHIIVLAVVTILSKSMRAYPVDAEPREKLALVPTRPGVVDSRITLFIGTAASTA